MVGHKRAQRTQSNGGRRFFEELAARPALGCHNHGGTAMPEASWACRLDVGEQLVNIIFFM
jgi:hypothetical protein